MNQKTAIALYAFYELSLEERAEFIRKANDYGEQSTVKQKEIKESTKRVSLGPLASTASRCPYCGK